MSEESFTIFVTVFVLVVFAIGWYFWPKNKIEKLNQDSVPETAPIVEEVKPTPVAPSQVAVDPVSEPVKKDAPKTKRGRKGKK